MQLGFSSGKALPFFFFFFLVEKPSQEKVCRDITFHTIVDMICLTALFCKGFGRELSPKSALTYSHYTLFSHLKVWQHTTNMASVLAVHHWARQGSHIFRRSKGLLGCPRLFRWAGSSVGEFIPNYGSGCLWKGHLLQISFYMFFLYADHGPRTTGWVGAAWWMEVCERRCTRAPACANVASLVNPQYCFISWILVINKHLPSPALCQNTPLMFPL